MQKRWREGAVGRRVVWQAAVRHSRSTSLQRAAIWATQHQNSSVSPPLQNKSTTAFGLNRGRLDRRLGVATWPPPSRVFTPRLESTLTNSLARNRNTLTSESQPTRAYAGACGAHPNTLLVWILLPLEVWWPSIAAASRFSRSLCEPAHREPRPWGYA